MKKFITILSLNLSVTVGFAQQDAQFSQNMFNRLAINPGYAGSNNAICATLLGRQQWLAFDKGQNWGGGTVPKTYLISVEAPIAAIHGGAGINIIQDQIGFDKTLIANLTYSFRMPLGPGNLGIGINGGILSKSLKGDWKAPDGAEALAKDQSIPKDGVNTTAIDASFGVYYNISDELYVGISSTHIPASTLKSDKLNFDLARHYYLMGGYNYALPNPKLELRPSFFVKTVGSTTQMDLNCNLMYDKMVWGGVSYRVSDAVVGMVGFQHSSGAKIGIAYDFTTSGIKNNGSVNTFEIMLGYCHKLPEPNKMQKNKNVRFL